MGGELNAATSLDATAYYARTLKDDIGIALDILADILQNPRYSADELEREREVILQEIAATRDSPDDIVYDLVLDAAFPGQPLGRPILGTRESVTGFTSAQLREFLASRYRAGRMVLSAAGYVDHAALVRHAEALFGALPRGDVDRVGTGPVRWRDAPLGQALRASPCHHGLRGSILAPAGVLCRSGLLRALRRRHVFAPVPGSA